MAKLASLATLLLALIAVTTAYTTVVTSTIINDDKNPQPSCQTEADWTRMTHCKEWMERGSFLRSVVANPKDLEFECCIEMWRVHQYCRCDMARKMMPTMGLEKIRSMFSKCGMEIPPGCRH